MGTLVRRGVKLLIVGALLSGGPQPAEAGIAADLSGVVLFPEALPVAPELVPPVVPPGTNENIADRRQNEPFSAVDPDNPVHLLGGANDYGAGNARCGFYWSIDGGGSWTAGVVPGFVGFAFQGDPSVGFDAAGNGYYACLAFNLDSRKKVINGSVAVSKSTDGGATWGNPVFVTNNKKGLGQFLFVDDKEMMAIDTSGGSFSNRIYVSWTRFNRIPLLGKSEILFSVSGDSGRSFSSPKRISTLFDDVQGSDPAVGPNGEVYVVWRSYPIHINMRKSVDGGTTFGAITRVADVSPLSDTLNGGFRVNEFPSIAVDRSSGPNRGNVYAVWADNRNGDPDILFTRSTDGGQTWSGPIRVNDDQIGDKKDQFFPWISVDSTHGVINVVFYDRRNDPNNLLVDVYLARSVDGGMSFLPNQRITGTSFDPTKDPAFSPPFIGDYIGVAATSDRIYPLWTDTRRGNDGIFGIAPFLYVSNWPNEFAPCSGGAVTKVNYHTGVPILTLSGFDCPEQMTIDPKGRIYVPESDLYPGTGTSRIERMNPDGSERTVVTTAICGPEGLSFDTEGNLFSNTRESPCEASGVWEVPGGEPTSTPVNVIPAFSAWGEGTAFFTQGTFGGNLLAVASPEGTVVQSSPPGFGTVVDFITGLATPVGVALNAQGQVFVADVFAGAIFEFDSSGGFVSTFASGLSSPLFLGFDVSDNLYVAEFGTGNVLKVLRDGTSTIVTNVSGAVGIAVGR